MAEALYRTYRPQVFSDVVDQQHIRITLQNALQQDRVAHAYLFVGPRGVGKTTLARILARAVNCTKRTKDNEPCNTCPNCIAMLTNSSLDIIEIDAASQTGVDNVRENIIHSAQTIPTLARRKVFIIDEVHMLSMSAFNALLKLLEEPPAHAMFILATTEVHRVPETIISRTQRFDFKKVGVEDIATRLQKIATAEQRVLDDDVARRIARQSGGSIRDAETMLGQLFSFDEKRITNTLADIVLPHSDQQFILALLTELVHHRTVEAITMFHHFCDEGGDIPTLVHDVLRTVRGLLLCAVDQRLIQQVAADFDQSDVVRLTEMATMTTVDDLERLVEAFLKAERRLSTATMTEFPVELAIISYSTLDGLGDRTEPPPMSVKLTSSPSSLPTEKPSDPPPAPLAPTIHKKPVSGAQLTLQAVRDVWGAIQRTIGHSYPSIGLSIQHAVIGDVNDTEVILHVPFKLHADRLNDPKYSGPLKTALDEALGQSVHIRVIVTDLPVTELPQKSQEVNVPVPIRTPAPTVSAVKPLAPKNDLWDQVVASFS